MIGLRKYFLAAIAAFLAVAAPAQDHVGRMPPIPDKRLPVSNPLKALASWAGLNKLEVTANIVGDGILQRDLPIFLKREIRFNETDILDDKAVFSPAALARWQLLLGNYVREMQRIVAANPDLFSCRPKAIAVYGKRFYRLQWYEADTIFTPEDLEDPALVRAKLLNAMMACRAKFIREAFEKARPDTSFRDSPILESLLGKTYDAAIAERDGLPPTDRAMRFDSSTVGAYSHAMRDAAAMRARYGAAVGKLATDTANTDVLDHMTCQLDKNVASAPGTATALQGFLAEFARRERQPNFFSEWNRFVYQARSRGELYRTLFTKYHENPMKPSGEFLSMVPLLQAFAAQLPPDKAQRFAILRQQLGITDERLNRFEVEVVASAYLHCDPHETVDYEIRQSPVATKPIVAIALRGTVPSAAPLLPGMPSPADVAFAATLRETSYPTYRGLHQYFNFWPTLAEFVAQLGKEHHWVDMGSGQTNALIEMRTVAPEAPTSDDDVRLVTRRPLTDRPRGTGVTFEYEGKVPVIDGLRILHGRLFQQLSNEEIGMADLITDLHGVFDYSPDRDEVLRRYLQLLKPGGKIFLHAILEGVVKTKDRGEISFAEWLETLPGLEVKTQGGDVLITVKPGETPRIPKLALTFASRQRVRYYVEQ